MDPTLPAWLGQPFLKICRPRLKSTASVSSIWGSTEVRNQSAEQFKTTQSLAVLHIGMLLLIMPEGVQTVGLGESYTDPTDHSTRFIMSWESCRIEHILQMMRTKVHYPVVIQMVEHGSDTVCAPNMPSYKSDWGYDIVLEPEWKHWLLLHPPGTFAFTFSLLHGLLTDLVARIIWF